PDGTEETQSGFATDTSPLSLTFTYDWQEDGGLDISGDGNTIMIQVHCTDADDQYPFFSPFNRRTIADNGNDYTLVVDYSYTE
ncbi:MAG: hypothetical protein JSW25_08650, partial [Thermoplasmata archaeon]